MADIENKPIVTRAQAKEQGLKQFYTGIPCKRGHISERNFRDGCCVICDKDREHSENYKSVRRIGRAKKSKEINEKRRILRKINPKYKEQQRTWRKENIEKVNEKKRKWRHENSEKARKQQAASYIRNLEYNRKARKEYREKNRERTLQILKEYWGKNREELRRKKREHYQKNKERLRKEGNEYKRNNRAKYRVWAINYEARKRNAEGKHSVADINKLYELQKGKCAICFCCLKKGYHVDHIKSLKRGGSNWPSNLQLLCPRDNCSKKTLDNIEYAKRLGRLL